MLIIYFNPAINNAEMTHSHIICEMCLKINVFIQIMDSASFTIPSVSAEAHAHVQAVTAAHKKGPRDCAALSNWWMSAGISR